MSQLAGLPRPVIQRAHEVLADLEGDSRQTGADGKKKRPKKETTQQLPLFGQKPPILEELEKLDINSLTPLQALTKLYELQQKAREG